MDKKEQLKKALWDYGRHSVKLNVNGDKANLAYVSTKRFAYCLMDGIGEVNKIRFEHAKNVKLCLLPLSALTEEIEHLVTGEKFVPNHELEELFGSFETQSNLVYFSIENWTTWKDVSSVIDKLHEWHIDIYDLIGQDLAIDKRTIKQ